MIIGDERLVRAVRWLPQVTYGGDLAVVDMSDSGAELSPIGTFMSRGVETPTQSMCGVDLRHRFGCSNYPRR